MDKTDLDKRREEIIEEIKRAFPVTPFVGKLTMHDVSYTYENDRLMEWLSGKTWPEIVSHPKVFYYLSDVDFLRAISGDAYHYYLPALLIASLLDSDRLFYHFGTYEQISEIATSLTVRQLKAIIGYLEYQDQLLNMEENMILRNFDLEAIMQKTYLRLLDLLYEQGSRAIRDE